MKERRRECAVLKYMQESELPWSAWPVTSSQDSPTLHSEVITIEPRLTAYSHASDTNSTILLLVEMLDLCKGAVSCVNAGGKQ